MQVKMTDLRVGDVVKILGFIPVNLTYQKKLLAMGLVPDSIFKVIRVAPLGDPIEIRVHHFSLCVRRQEGMVLQLERVVAA